MSKIVRLFSDDAYYLELEDVYFGLQELKVGLEGTHTGFLIGLCIEEIWAIENDDFEYIEYYEECLGHNLGAVLDHLEDICLEDLPQKQYNTVKTVHQGICDFMDTLACVKVRYSDYE